LNILTSNSAPATINDNKIEQLLSSKFFTLEADLL